MTAAAALPDEVRAAVEAGMSVIRVRADKKPVGQWKDAQTGRASAGELAALAGRAAAWAVVCGGISGVVVLDFDGEQGNELLRRLDLRPHVRTGSGGHHVYLRRPPWPVRTLNGKSKRQLGERWPGLDVRADGGYAIFAGRNGEGAYRLLRPLDDPEPVDSLPAELRADLGLDRPPDGPPPRAVGPTPDRLLELALDRAEPGARNDAGLWLACQARDNGYGQADADRLLAEYAARAPAGDHPYTPDEAAASVRQAYARPAREPWGAGDAPRGGEPGEDADRAFWLAWINKRLREKGLGHDVFVRARKIGTEKIEWWLTLRRADGAEVDVGPIPDAKIIEPRPVRAAIWEGARVVIPQLKEPDWARVAEALDRAADHVDDGYREAEVWEARVAAFVGDAPGSTIDPDTQDGKREIVRKSPGSFLAPDGHRWISSNAFAENLALRRVEKLSAKAVAGALKHRLDYASREIQADRTKRHYLRSPCPADEGGAT